MIEKASGQTYEDYGRTNVLAKWGVTRAFLGGSMLENRLPGLWVRQTGTMSDVRILPPADVRIDGVAFDAVGDGKLRHLRCCC